MPFARRLFLLRLLKSFDIACMLLCFFAYVWILHKPAEHLNLYTVFHIKLTLIDIVFFLCIILVWHCCFVGFNMYWSKRLVPFRKEMVSILMAATLGSLLIYILLHLFHYTFATHQFFLLFWLSVTLSILLSRLLLKGFLHHLRRKGRNLRFVVIIGTNANAVELGQMVAGHQELGYLLVGYVDNHWQGIGTFLAAGHTLLSDLSNFPAILRDQIVDEVWIAVPNGFTNPAISDILQYCDKFGLVTRHLNNEFGLKAPYLKTETLGNEFIITQYPGQMQGLPYFFKRCTDILASLVLLVLFSPLFLAAAVLIKGTSPGPILFRQERIGFNKRKFICYKFRTMVQDAEKLLPELEHLNQVQGPSFKMDNDPRVTAVGRLLRKTSIDELPQLLNVLKGEMSLVGPRPFPVRDFERFEHDWYRRRFCVLPGITGLMQVHDRNLRFYDKSIKLDLQYIANWSYFLDLKILAKTVIAVLKMSGAK